MCFVEEDGIQGFCFDVWGVCLGMMFCCVWIQIGMVFILLWVLNKFFFKLIIGVLLIFVGVYFVGNGLQNWGGSGNCYDGIGYYVFCFNVDGFWLLFWGDFKFIGLGFSVFVLIIFVEIIGVLFMCLVFVIIGFVVGCVILGVIGYWLMEQINQVFDGIFFWIYIFSLFVDGVFVFLMFIMFVCQVMSCIFDILVIVEFFDVVIEGIEFNSWI